MNAICLVLDRLHHGFLGPYGNTWIDTPSLNRLAWESLLADQFLVPSSRLEDFYDAIWGGRHPLSTRRPPTRPLPDLLARRGVRTVLMTDDTDVVGLGRRAGFDLLQALPRPEAEQTASQLDDAHLVHCFAETTSRIEDLQSPFLAWIHLSSLGRVWDAPIDFRLAFRDEEDPEIGGSARVPNTWLESSFDPDDVLAAVHAYAGQIAALDHCLGGLLALLAEPRLASDTLLLVAGARGMPLGEHGRLGPCDESMYAELFHVPFLIRRPDGLGAGVRVSDLLQPLDGYTTLANWFTGAETAEPGRVAGPGESLDLASAARDSDRPRRDHLVLGEPNGNLAIHTPAWYWRSYDPRRVLPFSYESDAARRAFAVADEARVAIGSLYTKPDDRWEVNDVADRCRDVVEQLEAACAVSVSRLRSDDETSVHGGPC